MDTAIPVVALVDAIGMNRRNFLQGIAGILAAGVAPAIIGSGILMPVRTIWTPPTGLRMDALDVTLRRLEASGQVVTWRDIIVSNEEFLRIKKLGGRVPLVAYTQIASSVAA